MQVEHRGGAVVRDHRNFDRGNVNVVVRGGDRGWHGGGRVVVDNRRGYSRPYYSDRGYSNRGYYNQVARRPIFVSRPIIRDHYYDYYRRPSLIIENYNTMPGYYWVPGTWTWSGYEWMWQPGHYQPDANYVDPAYDSGYYDNGY
ncbi:MAG TPA: hypothetical protein VGD37_04415 [Kofleriaceae bacterium]